MTVEGKIIYKEIRKGGKEKKKKSKKTNFTTKLNKNIINGREWKESVKKMGKMRRVKKRENGKRVRKGEDEEEKK